MANSAIELDFFRMERENKYTSSAPQPKRLFGRHKSFRDIQGEISKMNPELLKSVIGSRSLIDQIPNAARPTLPESTSDTAPLTIFYNGTLAIFNVSKDKADSILQIAEGSTEVADKNSATCSSNQGEFSMSMDGDLPMARRKSLQRFLAKRKDRVTLSSPYFCPEKNNTLFTTLNL